MGRVTGCLLLSSPGRWGRMQWDEEEPESRHPQPQNKLLPVAVSSHSVGLRSWTLLVKISCTCRDVHLGPPVPKHTGFCCRAMTRCGLWNWCLNTDLWPSSDVQLQGVQKELEKQRVTNLKIASESCDRRDRRTQMGPRVST